LVPVKKSCRSIHFEFADIRLFAAHEPPQVLALKQLRIVRADIPGPAVLRNEASRLPGPPRPTMCARVF
jgi:hypothetical protein